MKNLQSIAIASVLVLNLMACKDAGETNKVEQDTSKELNEEELSKTAELEFNNETSEQLFNSYLKVKDALVASNLKEANSGAKELKEVLGEDLKTVAIIQNAKTLEEARAQMPRLSDEIEELVSSSITSGAIYKQYCPMALNNTGGYWLSSEEKILNPYFGDKMLKCGKIDSKIQ
jgi:hypothetical protein